MIFYGENPSLICETYKGFSYRPESYSEVPRSVLHGVETPDGKRLLMDYDPHRVMRPEVFRMWVDAGRPCRKALSLCVALRDEHIIKLHAATHPVMEAAE